MNDDENQELTDDKLQAKREEEQENDQRNNDLKAREARLKEIEHLIPSVKELQSNGITFDLILPYIIAINEKSVFEKIDVKRAAI